MCAPGLAGRSSCWRSCQAPWVTTRSPGLRPPSTATSIAVLVAERDLAALELLARAQHVHEVLAFGLEHRLSGIMTASHSLARVEARVGLLPDRGSATLSDWRPRTPAWRRASCGIDDRAEVTSVRPRLDAGQAAAVKAARSGRASRGRSRSKIGTSTHTTSRFTISRMASPGRDLLARGLGDPGHRARDRGGAPCRLSAAAAAATAPGGSCSASRCATAAASVASAVRQLGLRGLDLAPGVRPCAS